MPGGGSGGRLCAWWFGSRNCSGTRGAGGGGGRGGFEGSMRERTWTVEVEGSSVQVPVENPCEWWVSTTIKLARVDGDAKEETDLHLQPWFQVMHHVLRALVLVCK